jgi:arylsulfatase A-like enzyme/Tfp pilus assembly protein PilF
VHASRTTKRLAVALFALLAIVASSWRIHQRRGSPLGLLPNGGRPANLNVLILTLDTTRWDRIGAYGDRTASTPNLDRIAAEGVLFEQAIAAAPLTLPAHATLFTGLFPPRHGVRDNGGYTLDVRHRTLASLLKQEGRATGAFVSAFVLDSRWGLDHGFDEYFDRFDLAQYTTRALGQIARRGSEVVDAALPWLEAHRGAPFFAWVHFYDPHAPYEPPEPFRSRFAGHAYAGEIAYMDSQIGRLLQWLETRRLAERTVVIVVGDHGESLQEHAENTHGIFVYDATTRVPLIIRTPYAGMRGRRVLSAVRSADVMPTALDLAGAQVPGGLQGRSLVTLMTGEETDANLEAYSESLYPRNHYGWSDLRALRSGRFKYIQAPQPELYDLERDPGERHNLYVERQSLGERMARELGRVAAEQPDADIGPSSVDPETHERLAALGYIGSFAPAARKPGERAADPKDKIDIFNLMTSAQETLGPEDSSAAIARLRSVLAKDPGILDAWIMLGNEHFKRREFERALEQYKEALKIRPDFDLGIVNVAGAYRALGQYDAAVTGFERYLQADPKNAWVRYQLGELYVDLGRLDLAEAAFSRALADDTRVASARNALGVVAFRRGDLVTAERQIRAALAERPDVKLAHFNLALVAEARHDPGTAVMEYQKEIALHGDAFKAAFNLGKLYEQMGNVSAQEAAWRQSIDMNPRFAEGHIFLAKLYLDQGRRLDDTLTLARRGLELGPSAEFAPLGHYVIADVLSRRGRMAESEDEATLGRALEEKWKREKGKGKRLKAGSG